MLDGKLIEATHLINKLDPTILEEPKLMFEFHKQQVYLAIWISKFFFDLL